MGLTSRDGIVPLHLRNDIGGPMARSVKDAVSVLEVIAGYDPMDPITKRSIGRATDGYIQFLDKNGLKGANIGVFRFYTNQPTADSEVKALFERAIEDMRGCGAKIVDPFEIEDFEKISEKLSFETFREDLGAYLTSRGEKAQYKSLKEIYDSGKYSPHLKKRIKKALDAEKVQCQDLYSEPRNLIFRNVVVEAMQTLNVDVIIYPTWNNPPRVIGDMESPAGDNSQKIPPHTGLPGMTVPMGFTYGKLPAGLQFVGRLFSEPTLIRIAYAYEQATRHRRPPELYT
jgi:Asp-tRNA(Asn)/Glu-tRNA(Gln) amidotransferase A subunit family amidase